MQHEHWDFQKLLCCSSGFLNAFSLRKQTKLQTHVVMQSQVQVLLYSVVDQSQRKTWVSQDCWGTMAASFISLYNI